MHKGNSRHWKIKPKIEFLWHTLGKLLFENQNWRNFWTKDETKRSAWEFIKNPQLVPLRLCTCISSLLIHFFFSTLVVYVLVQPFQLSVVTVMCSYSLISKTRNLRWFLCSLNWTSSHLTINVDYRSLLPILLRKMINGFTIIFILHDKSNPLFSEKHFQFLLMSSIFALYVTHNMPWSAALWSNSNHTHKIKMIYHFDTFRQKSYSVGTTKVGIYKDAYSSLLAMLKQFKLSCSPVKKAVHLIILI